MTTEELFTLSAFFLLGASLLAFQKFSNKDGIRNTVRVLNFCAVLLMAAGFVLRWVLYHEKMEVSWLLSFPVSTFYESASFFVLCLLLILLALGRRKFEGVFWGAVDACGALILLALTFSAVPTKPVMFLPSLKSYWLLAHVTLSFIAYSFFAVSAVFGVLVLLGKNAQENTRRLENLIYQGTLIFTVGGIIFGAIWAQHSWGRFWDWDPKETWAFITWCLYILFLHFDLSKKLSPRQAAAFSLFNFAVVIFTYLGVNVLFAGLHSYSSLSVGA